MKNFLEKVFKQNLNHQLKENEAEEFLQLFNEGVVALDKKLSIVYANKKALDLLQSKEKINKQIFDLCRNLALSAYNDQIIYTKTIYEDSLKFYVEVSATPQKDKKGVFLIFQDKTADYKMLKMGKEFVNNASHELRTPLTIIKGFSEILKEQDKLDKTTVDNVIQKIINTSQRLENIITDLLTLAKVENLQTLSFFPCDLKKIILTSIEMFSLAFPECLISLKLPKENIYVLGQEGLLEMAIKNLLENGVKYCKKRPEIFLSLSKREEAIQITIEDNGIGIAKEEQPFIFDRFYRVDKTRSRKLGGTGLGLSLVKNIFEKHQGQVSVTSKVDKGTSFKIKLPFLEKKEC